jgi:hypothetical protein
MNDESMLAGHTAIHVSNAIFQRGGMRCFFDEKLALAIPPLLSASPRIDDECPGDVEARPIFFGESTKKALGHFWLPLGGERLLTYRPEVHRDRGRTIARQRNSTA